MKRKPRQVSDRTVRRASSREQDKSADVRERLFRIEPGGSEQRPLEVVSASVVETHALGVPCPRCGGGHELVEHAALTTASGARLREARLRCRMCGSHRSLWFRIVGESVN